MCLCCWCNTEAEVLNLAARKSAVDERNPQILVQLGGVVVESMVVENATRSARAHPYLATV